MAVSKVILNGDTLIDVTQKTVTSGSMLNGTTALKNDGTDITGNIASKTSSDMTVSGDTVTAPAGYYASAQSKSVASGTAGTPTATKGTVSNHSVSVTPSVTNTTGYITGSTKTGTAVTVSASELDSGTKSISANGTGIDVVGYAAVDVAVQTGVDIPVFTVAYDVHNNITSITCNKTFNECFALLNNTPPTYGALVFRVTPYESGESYTVTGYSDADDAGFFCKYLDLTEAGEQVDIIYRPNGTIEIISPSEILGTVYDPVATKGTVSNHSVSITPSVGIDSGYISGGTYTGTPVTVDVTELESGTKTITENGTGISVSGYSAVDVNVSGGGGGAISITDVVDPVTGGTARYINAVDISDTTAVAADVAQGKYFYTAAGVKTAGSASGGGGGGASKKQINFIDYDGTILYSYTKAEFNQLSDLPVNPAHTGLTSQGWNWTKQQITSQLTSAPDGDVWVGQMYITSDGKTRFYCHFEERRAPYLCLCPNGSVEIDWGDNSTTDTLTGTSTSTTERVQHTYVAAGDYVITVTPVSGTTFAFPNGQYTHGVLRLDTSTGSSTISPSRVYFNAIRKVEIGSSITNISTYAFRYSSSLTSITIPDTVTSIGISAFNGCYSLTSITISDGVTSIGGNAFYNCYSLTSITIPDTVTSIGAGTFYNCFSLTSITIPDGVTIINGSTFYSCFSLTSITIPDTVTSIGSSAFYTCYSLTSITIPDGVTSIGSSAFMNCFSLTSITIPDTVTSIADNAFYGCYSLTSITIPDGVTSIGSSAFSSCYGMIEYHILPETPPTLSDTAAFSSIPSDCKIYVPYSADHSVLNAYKTETNWSTYASYMEEEPN